MLQAKTTTGGFEIRNSQQKLQLNDQQLDLGQLSVSEPGEYEADGIEIVYGETAALIVWEKLQIAYIFGANKPSTFEKTQFSPCDILIFSRGLATLGKTFFNETLEIFDPKLVVLSQATNIEEVRGTVKSAPVETAKLAEQSLPEEGRDFIILS